MSPFDSGSVICPMCSAENSRGAARCFLCGQSLSGVTEVVPPKLTTEPEAGRRATFQITSMMLLIALIAVFLGVFHEAPGVAMVLAVPGTIALIRTLAAAGHRPGPPSWFDHVAVFAGTFMAVVTVAVAAGVSFFATCLAIVATNPGPYGGDNIFVGLIVGGIVGLAVIIGLTVAFVRWGRRMRPR
jgi:multisubunit Na+/H+ antiporter MnhB subunit